MNYIKRDIEGIVRQAAETFPVIEVIGPRQSGKSTLCNHLFPTYTKYNFEDIALRQSVLLEPKGFLDACGDTVVFDEVQRVPDILSYIQIAVDTNPERRFVLTGSSNFALMESITQSLAGRSAVFTLLPFSINELGGCKNVDTDELLFKGFYPRVVAGNHPVELYYGSYYSTYVERDVRQLKNISNLSLFQTFMALLALRVGSEFNAASLSTELGVSAPTIKSWLSLLHTSYIAFPLQPYYSNIGKRLTKTPKIYFYDTGLLCRLLEIESAEQLQKHPLRGAIFENLAVIELLKERLNKARLPKLYFYRESSGKEVDIIRQTGLKMDLFEIKSGKTYNSQFSKNMQYLKTLFGDTVSGATVVYDGDYIPPDVINIRALSTRG